MAEVKMLSFLTAYHQGRRVAKYATRIMTRCEKLAQDGEIQSSMFNTLKYTISSSKREENSTKLYLKPRLIDGERKLITNYVTAVLSASFFNDDFPRWTHPPPIYSCNFLGPAFWHIFRISILPSRLTKHFLLPAESVSGINDHLDFSSDGGKNLYKEILLWMVQKRH
jgi:hypothetical protein